MKLTSKMTAIELAKVWADHFGLKGAPGGWIYTDIKTSPLHPFTGEPMGLGWVGTPVAHGWLDLAHALQTAKFIEVGVGINWRLAGDKPKVWRSNGVCFVRAGR